MTIRGFLQRFGKPLIIILLTACVVGTLRGSIKDVAKLHPQNYGMLATAMALFVVHYLIQAFGWHFILRALKQPIALRDSMRMYFLSLIARWMPGRIWYSATRLYIGRQLKISVTAIGFAMVLELIYLLIGGIIVTVGFAGYVLRGVLSTPQGHMALYAGVAIIALGGMLIIKPSTLTSVSRLGFVRKVMRKIAGEELTDANRPEMTTASSLALIVYFTLFWVYSGLMFGVLSAAFIPMTPERWAACLPAFAGSWLIGFFSIVTPAGIGVREFAMTVMLKESMGQAAAIVMSIASRLAMMFTELLLAGIAYAFLRNDLGDMPFAAARKGAAPVKGSPAPSTGGLRFELPADTLPDANELLDTPILHGGHRPIVLQRSRGRHRDWSMVKRRPCFCGRGGAVAAYKSMPRRVALTGYALYEVGKNGHGKAGASATLTRRKPSTKRRPCRCGDKSDTSKVPTSHFKNLPKIPALAEDQ